MSRWHVDRAYVDAFASAVSALGVSLDGLGPGPREMLRTPRKHGWWPGDALVELVVGLAQRHGRPGLESITRKASHDGMARLVRPVLVNVLALSGSPPHSLFSRVGMFTTIAVRGVVATYERTPSGCRLTYTFPDDVPELMTVVWVGQVDLGLALAGGGRIEGIETTPRVHHLSVAFAA